MKKTLIFLLGLVVFVPYSSMGQTARKCGYEIIHNAALKKNPNFDKELEASQASMYKRIASFARKTTTSTYKIPVVFHVVLDTAQINELGGVSGIIARINSQMQVINEDYNRENADSVGIPGAFKPYYQSANIQFGLAKIDPDGNPTNGWEIITTSQTSFDLYAASPASDAKHTSTGGADAWDNSKYLNIWVTSFNDPSVLGLTLPPSYTSGPTPTYPASDRGVLINYLILGKRTSADQKFYLGNEFDGGRSLTHEIGHFFELKHPWGDDGGKCPGSGGVDDGIADTPPEAGATTGSPSFPHYDACTATSPGTMFMNFMEYTDDSVMHMFTHDQDSVMDLNLMPGGESYSLTQHPELLSVPYITGNNANPSISISPNPTTGKINVVFNQTPKELQSISVVNLLGQVVRQEKISIQSKNIYTFNLSGLSKGVYFVECQYNNGKDVRKIVLQ